MEQGIMLPFWCLAFASFFVDLPDFVHDRLFIDLALEFDGGLCCVVCSSFMDSCRTHFRTELGHLLGGCLVAGLKFPGEDFWRAGQLCDHGMLQMAMLLSAQSEDTSQ